MLHNVSTLLVVSHVVHYRHDGRLFAYGPYAREMDVWADLFPRVVVAAPCRTGVPPGDAAPLARENVTIAPQVEAGGDTVAAKIALAVRLPALVARLVLAMRRADAIHVRCPGNLGLLGALLAPVFSTHLVAKYAGQWNGRHGEARSERAQRAILRSRWWRGPVMVYGDWPGQPAHVKPFFATVLDQDQIARARAAARRPRGVPPAILFVGRLSQAKNVDVLLAALRAVRDAGGAFRAVIVGEGPERGRLEALSLAHGLHDIVTFAGGVSFDRVLGLYERSDVLVLASDTEGYPKVITEAMAFGLACIGSNCGLVPRILEDGRGTVVPPRDAGALASALRQVLESAGGNPAARERAAAWAQQHSLETFRQELSRLLSTHWGPAFQPRLGRTASMEKSTS